MTDERIQRIMRDHNVSEATATYIADTSAAVEKRVAAMAEKRAVLHRISVEEADIDYNDDYPAGADDMDSGSLSEDEERERSEWLR